MTALDTNVLVRLVVNDDDQQVHRAHAFLAAQDRVLISRTVLLELGWVLASGYQLSARQLHRPFGLCRTSQMSTSKTVTAGCLLSNGTSKGWISAMRYICVRPRRDGVRYFRYCAAPDRSAPRNRACDLDLITPPSESCRCAGIACRPASA